MYLLCCNEWSIIYAAEQKASSGMGSIRKVTREVNGSIRTHIKPGLGAIQLDALDAHLVQSFYNGLREPTKERAAVSPKTVKNVRRILLKTLQQVLPGPIL